MDLNAQSVKITPQDITTYATIQKPGFHTFPRKNISRKQSLEHIYDEIPIKSGIAEANQLKSEKVGDFSSAQDLHDLVEKTKM